MNRRREKVLKAQRALLNGSGGLAYFEARGIAEETIRRAYVGYEANVLFPEKKGTGYKGPAFTYPCVSGGKLLGIHYKSEARNVEGKRRQKWGDYADDLPPKGRGKRPDEPAKIIPFGLETLKDLNPGSPVVLNCGEEDALSARQAGYTALSQPGAGLLQPAYAKAFAGLDVVVFYDAGEEPEARKDALTLLDAGAEDVRVARWPDDAPNGADVNGRLVEDPEGFAGWLAPMIEGAKPVDPFGAALPAPVRDGEPDDYRANGYRRAREAPIPEPQPWPTLPDKALYGLAGDVVRDVDEHTEADPVAVLANFLAAVGNVIGRGAHVRVGPDRHYLKLFVGIVGKTSKGRKGTSWGPARDLMREADEGWVGDRVLGGLSSGEGLIYAVRDRVLGVDKEGEEKVVDEGVSDKRLLVLESELAGTLKVMGRDGNTLSPVVRQAWDDTRLQVLTKNNPMKATDSHISIIGHITKDELLRHMTETETANGFANRFLWLMVQRSKLLPRGGEWWRVETRPLVSRITGVLEFGRRRTEIEWGDSAGERWDEVYGPLSEGKPGLFGAVVGRGEAQVLRLAALYAVLDRSETIEDEHLYAALALWDYAEASARYIFGDATGDPVADQITDALRGAGADGMTRTEVSNLFGRHKNTERINRAFSTLLAAGRVLREKEETRGRPSERWFCR